MKKLCLLKLLVFLLVFFSIETASAEERSTGWQCPAGSCNRGASTSFGNYHGYTGNGPSYGYHVGIDYMRDVDYPVYAIAHGEIVKHSDGLRGYGSHCDYGTTGGAVLIRHIAKGHDGYSRTIYADYGHMHLKSGLHEGDIVEKGEEIGFIHFYSGDDNDDGICNDDWTHLHFGIRPDEIDPKNPFRGIADLTSSDNGWTQPMDFLDDNYPADSEVDCDKLEDKYPDAFDRLGIYDCRDASYIYPNQYVVWHYTNNESEGYCGITTSYFEVNKNANIVELSKSVPDGIGYGGGESKDSPGSQTASNPPRSSSKPELFIKKFYFGSSGRTRYYTDEKISLYAQAKNVGIDVESGTNVTLNYYRFKGEKENGDTKKVGSDNIKGSNLEHNQTKTESLKVAIPDDEDKYQYYACIDTKRKVPELNEKNNCFKPLSIRAHERPDLALIDLTLNGGATSCEYGDSPFIQATIENSGGEPFEDVPVVWYLDDIHYADDNMRHWNIAHDDIKHEDAYLPDDLSVGIHTVRACYELKDDEDQDDSCLELSFEVVDQSLRADVDGSGVIDTADAMLILSKSAGKDMSQTDWIDSSITGDANCSGETTTTDALLVMRKSNGLPMEETAWCLEE